ncbi:MAG: gliding motility-associated C-terminal domain-containing protein, partial [Bacteroidota bacterium]
DATAPDAATVLWTTTGTGTFNDATLVNPVYTPSPNDILDGFVTLTMTVSSATPCPGDADQMVLTISRQAVVFAGFDAAICEGQTYIPISATAENAASLLWMTSGTGSFDDPSILYPVYTPGAADIAAGSVVLTLSAPSALPCPLATDNMVLTISPQAIAYAGADAIICEGSPYAITDAVASNAANILWTTSGTGTFNNPTLANPVYTPSPNDILDGFVTLTMIVNSDPPCGGDFDEMVLTISRQTNIYAGPDVSICDAVPYIINGATQQFAISLLWTTTGTGTFNDATSLNPEYSPSPADLAAGSVTLILTAQSAAPCGPDTDAMVLTISQQATAYAGADNIICEGSTYVLADATSTNAASVLWTTSGTGLFNNPTLANPTYIPSPNDIQDGFVTLTMFVNSAAPCIGTSDDMVLAISRQAFVNAGANAAICEGSDYMVNGATQQFTTGILWSTSGTGIFDDPTIINPVYTPGASDLAAGFATLTITGQSAAPCTPVSDDLILTISPQATAYAGSDNTICEGSSYTLTDATATDAVSVIWTSSGTGFFNNPALINPTYIPSMNDIQDGSVMLTLFVVSASPCVGASDTMVLGISRQAVVDAGQNAVICEGSSFTLSGASSQNASDLLWTTSGTGTFDDATIINPVYTPGTADIIAGSVILTVTGQSAAPCGPDTDNMVLSISSQATAYAGADNIICEGSTYTISDAMAVNAVSVYWTTTGTGVFNNPALVNPAYIPSPNDILDGFVTLTMFVSSASPCVGASDAMILGISRQAYVDAGQNAAICEGSSFTLSGASSQNANSLLWTTSGTGTFDDATIINPVYTPGTADIIAGSVILTVTGQSAAPCGPDIDAMTLTISQQATAYAGEDATICEGSTITLADAVAGNALSILWTTTGTGIFNNPAIANPTYIPSQNDILDGVVVLTMYANAASPCPGASDAMVLNISRQAVVYAGPDESICEGSGLTLDQATQSNATSLLWATSGTGTFSDPTILNPVYTPGTTDIITGSVTLTLSATSSAPCSQTNDAMVLSISRQATADAGPDDAICGSTAYALSGASATNFVSVYWTTSGTGTFNNQNLVNPVYTPSQNDIQDGSVTLTLTAYPNAPCGNASDAMVLTISGSVEIYAGADVTICEGGFYQLADATQTNTVSVLWTTSGTGTFDDPTILNPVYTPGTEDILNGSVTLTITGQAAPPCDAVSDEMVITISLQALAFAGEDHTICGGVSYTIGDASATNAVTILWTTTGTGVFNNPTIADPTYTPSQNDILDGYVTLTMMVTSAAPCSGDSDEMTLSISRQAVVNAGADATICENETFVPVGAIQQSVISLMWTTSGTGTFSDATILHPIYTPGIEDIITGSVTLILNAVSAVPCEEVSDSLVLSFSLQAAVSAGEDATVCYGAEYTLSGAVASGYTSLMWETSGTGIFSDATTLNAVYLPSNSDLFNGQVILTLTAESATGCLSATDQMVLTIDGLPFADAGPDLSVCQGEPLQIISATADNYVTIYWTYTGLGSMIGTNTLTPTYVPAENETGSIVLTVNVTGSEACGGLLYSDDMILTIKQKVISDAGEDQTIPYNSTTILNGNATNGSGSYVYNWQPSGLLVNNNTSNPATQQLTNHTDFILVVTDVVTGCQDIDTMKVTIDGINYPPVANDDFDTTRYNTPVRINILGNDSDPENGAMTVSFCGYPVNGLVVLNSNNTITYTPYEGFSGDDSLCYQICDKGIPVLCDEAKVYIHVMPKPDVDDIVIYHGVSPNGDGNNDIWKIKGIEGFPDNEVMIFNRWGDKIKDLSHYDNVNVFWDATNKHNELVPDGTYYYILEIRGVKTFTGWIYVKSEN